MFNALARLEEQLRQQGLSGQQLQAAMAQQTAIMVSGAQQVQAAATQAAAQAQVAATSASGQVQAAATQAATDQAKLLTENILPVITDALREMALNTGEPKKVLDDLSRAIETKDSELLVAATDRMSVLPEEIRKGIFDRLHQKYGAEYLAGLVWPDIEPTGVKVAKALAIVGGIVGTAGVGLAVAGALSGAAAAGAATAAGAGGAAATTAAGAGTAAAIAAGTGPALTAGLTAALVVGLKDAVLGIAGGVIAYEVVDRFNLGGWIMDTMLSPVTSALTSRAPTSPAAAGAVTEDVKGIMGRAMSSLIGMTIMSELMSPLKQIGLGYMSAMMGDAAGFRPIIAGIMGPHIKAGISIPLTYSVYSRLQPMVLSPHDAAEALAMGYLNEVQAIQHFRWGGLPSLYDAYLIDKFDKEPPLPQLLEALGRGKITLERFKRPMKSMAFEGGWDDMWQALAARPVSPFLVRLIADSEAFDEDILRDMMIDAGYKASHAEFMIYAFKLAVMKSYRSGLISSLIKNYKEGYATREEMMTKLGQLGIRPDLVELIAAQADYEYRYDYAADVLSAAKTAFSKDLITEDELRAVMGQYVVNPEKLEALLAKEVFKKLPKAKAPKPEV